MTDNGIQDINPYFSSLISDNKYSRIQIFLDTDLRVLLQFYKKYKRDS